MTPPEHRTNRPHVHSPTKENRMSVIDDLKKTVDSSPFYAAVGVTDLAVEIAREASLRAGKARVELSADLAPARVQARATKVAVQVRDLPALALNQTLVVGGKVLEEYDELAARGHKLVARILNQKATQDLVAQADTTVAQAKGAVTTARRTTAEVQRSAKATLTTARREAATVAGVLSDSVAEETRIARDEVRKSAKATRTAARRTSTTARDAAAQTAARAKGATTSARKTAAAAEQAVEATAPKVGDQPAGTGTVTVTTAVGGRKVGAKATARTTTSGAKPAARTRKAGAKTAARTTTSGSKPATRTRKVGAKTAARTTTASAGTKSTKNSNSKA
jgi:hypothetical protein